jgi:hypothetical protein
MFHLKYYVFLLIGVFLALGLGMLIGITLENQDLLENQQIQLVRQIEEQFGTLKQETYILKDQLKVLEVQKSEFENLSEMLVNEIVRNRLLGKNIAVIDLTDGKGNHELLDFIEMTGASVTANIQFSGTDNSILDYDKLAVYSIFGPADIGIALAEDLAYSFSYGGKTPLIQELEDLGVIKNLKDYENTVDSIIILSNGRNQITENSVRYDLMIIDAASRMGFQVIAAETIDADQSLIPDYFPYGISTLDHADSYYISAIALPLPLSTSASSCWLFF